MTLKHTARHLDLFFIMWREVLVFVRIWIKNTLHIYSISTSQSYCVCVCVCVLTT